MNLSKPSPSPAIFWRFAASVLLPFLVALGLFYLLFMPPVSDFGLMFLLMGGTTLASFLAAYGAYRLGWIYRSPRFRITLLAAYALPGLLVFLNVYVTAKMMFASQHDLLLAIVLLVFASGIAMAVGFFLSEGLTDRIREVSLAAEQVASGELDTRVAVRGRDEMASLAAAFNDMAARLQSAEQKQREVEALRRDLIAWVGHDLRTPLTSVRVVLEALADGLVEDPQTIQRYLHTAQGDIRSLSQLIDDLFELAQIDAGGLKLDLQPNSLGDLLSDTIESFTEPARRQQVSLYGEVGPGVDPVLMDAPRIGRVLSNLVSNALRHTPPGGAISLRAWRKDQAVLIEVRDTGEGIPVDVLPHVFERFYRQEKSRSRATGGAGLGLAIAQGIVEAHGGTIQVESDPGKGARFLIQFPVK